MILLVCKKFPLLKVYKELMRISLKKKENKCYSQAELTEASKRSRWDDKMLVSNVYLLQQTLKYFKEIIYKFRISSRRKSCKRKKDMNSCRLKCNCIERSFLTILSHCCLEPPPTDTNKSRGFSVILIIRNLQSLLKNYEMLFKKKLLLMEEIYISLKFSSNG